MSSPEELYPALDRKSPSICTLDELEEKYWREVAPDMRDAGLDPETDRPTHEWLSKNGHRDLVYALSEYHDTTFAVFWTDTLGLEPEEAGYDWHTNDDATREALERYLERRGASKWSDASVRAHRARLNRYVWAYAGANDTDDLLSPITPDSDAPAHESTEACWDAFEYLDRWDGISRRTLGRIYRSVDAWYKHLVNRRRAAINPVSGLDDEYDWHDDDDSPSNPALAPEDVRALYDATGKNEQRFLVVALCAWGLRSGEVARLHRRQLHLDDGEPYIEFEDRKNGPGTVTVVYDVHDAKVRVSRLQGEDWNGYLFPSERSETGHVTPNTIRNRFDDLLERASVDEDATPQMARRFWYDRYASTMEDVIEYVEGVAEEQGSESPEVVRDKYLSEERKRALRRRFMREKLADAFGELEDE